MLGQLRLVEGQQEAGPNTGGRVKGNRWFVCRMIRLQRGKVQIHEGSDLTGGCNLGSQTAVTAEARGEIMEEVPGNNVC